MKYHFAVFRGYIVTANSDGSIPLNAKVVAQLVAEQTSPVYNAELLQALIDQANENAA